MDERRGVHSLWYCRRNSGITLSQLVCNQYQLASYVKGKVLHNLNVKDFFIYGRLSGMCYIYVKNLVFGCSGKKNFWNWDIFFDQSLLFGVSKCRHCGHFVMLLPFFIQVTLFYYIYYFNVYFSLLKLV